VVDGTQGGKYDAIGPNIIGRTVPIEGRTSLDGKLAIIQCFQRCVRLRSKATSILLLYEFEPKTLNERFLWNAWKQVENRNKTGGKEFHDHG